MYTVYDAPIQDPRVFARCFRRPHFTRRILEDIIKKPIENLSPSSVGIFEYERLDGSIGYTAHISDVLIRGFSEHHATIIIQKDFSDIAHYTARQVDANFHPESTIEPVMIITFVKNVVTSPTAGPVLIYSMMDMVHHRLNDSRWEYFVCCDFADRIGSSYLKTLCRLLNGEKCNNDISNIIQDTAWGCFAEVVKEDEEEAQRYPEAEDDADADSDSDSENAGEDAGDNAGSGSSDDGSESSDDGSESSDNNDGPTSSDDEDPTSDSDEHTEDPTSDGEDYTEKDTETSKQSDDAKTLGVSSQPVTEESASSDQTEDTESETSDESTGTKTETATEQVETETAQTGSEDESEDKEENT